MIRDINLEDRKTYIFATEMEGVYPSLNIHPSPDLYPAGSGQLQLESHIVAGTMSLEEMIVDSDLQFGNLFSDKFEVTLYDVPDLAGYYIYVYQIENNVIKYIFTGMVDSSKKNKDGLDRQIVAYDNAYRYGNENVAEWWTNFWSNGVVSSSIRGLRTSLLDYYGISYNTALVLPNDYIMVHKNADISVITFSSMMKMLCEPNCCFPHFDRDGSMLFIVLDDESTATNISNLYEGENSEFEDYTTEKITGIQFLDSAGEVKLEVGNTTNLYAFGKDNILLYDLGTTFLTQIANNMLSYISDISYTPCSVKMICGDLNYKLGTRIITENNQEFYIMQNNYSGPQLVEQTMIAKGTQYQDTKARALQTSSVTLNERVSRLTVDVEHFESEYQDFTEDTASKFTQTAESISSEVTRATNAESSLSTQIQQTAESISLSVTNGDESSSFSLKLGQTVLSSGTIQMNGMVTFNDLETSGSTTINGDNITTGRISANNGNSYFDLDDGELHITNGRIQLGTPGQTDGWIDMTDDGVALMDSAILSNVYISGANDCEIKFDENGLGFYDSDTTSYGSYDLIGHVTGGTDETGTLTGIVLESKNNKHVFIQSDNTIGMFADEEINIKSDANTYLQAVDDVYIKATSDIFIQASGQVELKGSSINFKNTVYFGSDIYTYYQGSYYQGKNGTMSIGGNSYTFADGLLILVNGA